MMHLRISRTLLVPAILLGSIVAGCNRGPDPTLTSEIQRLNAELESARQNAAATEKARIAKQEDIALATAADSAKKLPPEPKPLDTEKDAQIRALQAEVASLKKRDAFVFADASAALKIGNGAALDRYQQFLKDFPNSPLAADADRAIAELTTAKEREARAHAMLVDPRRADREILQHFSDGTVTVKELSPLLKNRSPADVVKLLGPPTQTYRDGKELGYTDRVIDTATGGKGTLVIGFDSDAVSTLRVGYLGKPIKP